MMRSIQTGGAELAPLALPHWLAAAPAGSAEDLSFAAGAALAALHPLATGLTVAPMGVLRDRLALVAAEASLRLEGRPEGATALRDGVHLLRPGERPGPAGAVFALWREAVRRPVAAPVPPAEAPEEDGSDTTGQGPAAAAGPLAQAAAALEQALGAEPRDAAGALVAAEAALAGALGWPLILPLFAIGVARRDLRRSDDALRVACARAVVAAAPRAASLAADLARRAARLEAAAPGLRARGAAVAVRRFLAEDALAPGIALAGRAPEGGIALSDRAARRLCDRLVSLGALRELTGRAAFRLYGL